MITKINEVKTLVKHISCDCKCKFNSATRNTNQKWNNGTCQCSCKNYCMCKKDYSCNPSTCISENSKYLKCIVDESVIACDEIINIANSVSTNVTNAIPRNVTSIVSVNSDDKKVTFEKSNRLIQTISSVIICLLLLVVISIAILQISEFKNKKLVAILNIK